MAVNGQVDMIAADLTITTKRHEALEFTVPFMAAQVTVLLKKEKRRGTDSLRGSSPFHTLSNTRKNLEKAKRECKEDLEWIEENLKIERR